MQTSDEIEITPEMIEAAINHYDSGVCAKQTFREFVEGLIRAALAARPKREDKYTLPPGTPLPPQFKVTATCIDMQIVEDKPEPRTAEIETIIEKALDNLQRQAEELDKPEPDPPDFLRDFEQHEKRGYVFAAPPTDPMQRVADALNTITVMIEEWKYGLRKIGIDLDKPEPKATFPARAMKP
jgi:hypothetical protein